MSIRKRSRAPNASAAPAEVPAAAATAAKTVTDQKHTIIRWCAFCVMVIFVKIEMKKTKENQGKNHLFSNDFGKIRNNLGICMIACVHLAEICIIQRHKLVRYAQKLFDIGA